MSQSLLTQGDVDELGNQFMYSGTAPTIEISNALSSADQAPPERAIEF